MRQPHILNVTQVYPGDGHEAVDWFCTFLDSSWDDHYVIDEIQSFKLMRAYILSCFGI